MTDTKYDLVIIGAGPGGYVAAIRASQLGLKVAIVERENLGGVCLNWGCIPTKALLKSSEIGHILDNLDAFGFSAENITFDIKKIVDRSRKVAKQLSSGVSHLLKKNKVFTIMGTASLKKKTGDEFDIEVIQDNKKHINLKSRNVILATGARAKALPNIEPDGKDIWTYKEAMVPNHLPKSILVIGSGAIGIEFASFYNDLGVDITVVELQDRILPAEDADISSFARKAFEKQGIKIKTSSTVKSLKSERKNIRVQIDSASVSEEVLVEKVILAVGITGNIEKLGLESTAVEISNGQVTVDEWGATREPGLYAIGDLVGAPWLAHKASHEGVICVERIAGVEHVHPLDTNNIPGCTYSRPQIASVGMTQKAAEDAGHKIRVGNFPFIGNGKAIALGEMEGFVKTIFDATTGELLGAHMIGAEVTEMIHGYTVARSLETTEHELLNTVFPHPTLSEMMHESVLDAFDRAIHI
ncbi:MAG: dihydrolipoyl dehydrogenase [Pseudomonadota bacterium]|jgi:dihydrolipoamide dehydrogenase|nr:dihydrolipoyl dehydrogenase [Pseudomonadota bacterium]|tara:strand:+ start:2044 stop:3456 length:1413 start_codon:yes stop_codon:yes gene_type:complete